MRSLSCLVLLLACRPVEPPDSPVDDTWRGVEDCSNGVDDDLDGLDDCYDPDCVQPDIVCLEHCDDAWDNDRDGLTDCEDPDCELALACDAGTGAPPTAFSMRYSVGVSGGELSGYSWPVEGADSATISPTVLVELFDEAYFESFDARCSCAWAAELLVEGESPFEDEALWMGWGLRLRGDPAQNASLGEQGRLCDALDPAVGWGESTPATVFEGLAERGYAPVLALGRLRQALAEFIGGQVGMEAWDAEWRPYVFGAATSIGPEAINNLHYCFAYQADADMRVQLDDAGEPIRMEVEASGWVPPEGVEDLGPYAVVVCESPYFLYLSNIGL